ncbi:BC_2427 family protein [Bacillus clarus]|nr:hypothetical protein [Bacillus clarus]
MDKPWIGNKMKKVLFSQEKKEVNISKKIKPKKHTVNKHEESLDTKLKRGKQVCSMTVKTPFSIIGEVTGFSTPIAVNKKERELFVLQKVQNEAGTELVSTAHHYYEKPYCSLIYSKIIEYRRNIETFNGERIEFLENNNFKKSSWIPVHNINNANSKYSKYKGKGTLITTKLPIEIGKYRAEITVEEKVNFHEKVLEIKEISQEIILKESKFIPVKEVDTIEYLITAEKGQLFVEGYILQSIEYTTIRTNEKKKQPAYQFTQENIIELVIQLWQEQEVQIETM